MRASMSVASQGLRPSAAAGLASQRAPAVRCCLRPAARMSATRGSTSKIPAFPPGFLGGTRPLVQQKTTAERRPASRGHVQVSAYSYQGRRGGGGGSVSITDRVLAALPYFLPLMGALRYGRFFFSEFPAFGSMLIGFLKPLIQMYTSIPMAGFILFLVLYLGVANNTRYFSRFVRFNAMQAVLLDICLSLPSILEWILKPRIDQFYIMSCNLVWIFVFACVVYSMVSCLMGEKGSLPYLGDATDARLP